MKKSKRFQLNEADRKKSLENALVFLAPALLVFFSSLQAGLPIEQALYAIYLWGLNTIVDLLKKYVAGK